MSAVALGAYEWRVASCRARGRSVPLVRRASLWGAVAVLLAATQGPLDALAGSAAWAETLQGQLLELAMPLLVVLSAPLSLLGSGDGGAARDDGLAEMLASRLKVQRRLPGKGWVSTALFVACMVAWHVPGAVDGLRRDHWLLAVEALSGLVGAGALWTDLVGSEPLRALAQRPRRMLWAAVAAWSTWVFAYVIGMSSHPWYPAYAGLAGHHLGAAGDDELSAGILWVTSGLAFVPVVFVNLAAWFRDEDDPQEAMHAALQAERRRMLGEEGSHGASA